MSEIYVQPSKNTVRKSLNPAECWKDYPPGIYKRSDFLGVKHPSNVISLESDGHQVLLSYNFAPIVAARKITDSFSDRKFKLTGYTVHVWSKRSPIISVHQAVTDIDSIPDMIEELKAAVEFACHHENSVALPTKYRMVHKFRCLDCNEEWGYDSSG